MCIQHGRLSSLSACSCRPPRATSSSVSHDPSPHQHTDQTQGTFGNLGMYASGIPLGMVVDAKSPRWGVALGTVLFCAGYFPIAKGERPPPQKVKSLLTLGSV